jgi:hypothetical protein
MVEADPLIIDYEEPTRAHLAKNEKELMDFLTGLTDRKEQEFML